MIEGAKLTDEEINDLGFTFSDHRELVDAATTKALWAVVDWLAERTRTLFIQREDRAYAGARLLVQQYTGELLNAGIERPRVEMETS